MTRSLEELCEYLVGHWKFDNNFLDSSGNGNHGTPTDIEWKPTARGLKPYFDGSGYVDTGLDFSSEYDGNNFTVSTWYKIGDKQVNNWSSIIGCRYTKWVLRHYSDSDYEIVFTYNNDNSVSYELEHVPRWVHLTGTYKDGECRLYVDGVLVDSGNISQYEEFTGYYVYVGASSNFSGDAGVLNTGYIDDARLYNTALTDDEVLALYESTKQAYGVRPAERSFTHRLQPDVDANTVAAFDMGTKNSDGTLMDLSGNSNHGDIYGAVRSGGYFTDGLRFDRTNNNTVNLGNVIGYSEQCIILEGLYKIKSVPITYNPIIGKYDESANQRSFLISAGYNNTFLRFTISENGFNYVTIYSDKNIGSNKWIHFIGKVHDGVMSMFVDGIKQVNTATVSNIFNSSANTYIASLNSYQGFDGDILMVSIGTSNESDSSLISRFNSLAVLPLYSIDFSRYPTSTGHTGNVPYSSMRVQSGEFKFTDAGQLVCVTAGTITMRNAHEFDGSEYITLTADGVKTADTGSVIAGTTTASIEQGSPLITVNMTAGDTLDSIDIQFRKKV
jgi:hypothetical protein